MKEQGTVDKSTEKEDSALTNEEQTPQQPMKQATKKALKSIRKAYWIKIKGNKSFNDLHNI